MKGVEERIIFGGLGFLVKGNMLVSHFRPFDVAGKAIKGWAMVTPEGIEGDDQLTAWIKRAVKFVGKLPGK